MDKLCSSCRQSKDINAFYLDKGKSDGHNMACKECHARSTYEAYHRLRKEAMEKYGGTKCVRCGEDFYEVLTFDHIDNTGAQERRETQIQGKRFVYYLKRQGWPSGIQVLCHNCNHLKFQHPELFKL